MTQDEIDTMWQQAMRQSIEDGEMFTRYHFAKLIATKEREALAQPPRPMQECPNYEDCKGACFQCEYFNAETGTVEYPPQRTEQEPVAWRRRKVGGGWQYFGWQETGMTYQDIEIWNKNGFECEAIFVTPPQRTEQEPVVEMKALADNDSAYAYADGWNACVRKLATHPPQRTEPKVCCQQYNTCLEPCTPRGRHLAQPEQEPVAWAVYCDGLIALPSFDSELEARQEMQRRNRKFPHNKRKVKALYDTSPQRTWVGLTDEEFDELDKEDLSLREFVQAIDDRLKQKNGYTEEKNT